MSHIVEDRMELDLSLVCSDSVSYFILADLWTQFHGRKFLNVDTKVLQSHLLRDLVKFNAQVPPLLGDKFDRLSSDSLMQAFVRISDCQPLLSIHPQMNSSVHFVLPHYYPEVCVDGVFVFDPEARIRCAAISVLNVRKLRFALCGNLGVLACA